MLPKKIIIMDNKDKAFHEQWRKTRDLMDIPHPFRILIAGNPGSGKTMNIMNIILRVEMSRRPFRKIIVVHCDPEYTAEYEDLECEMLAYIPQPSQFSGDCKTLVILEDLEYSGLDKIERGALNRLFGFASTHKHISVIGTAQDLFDIPPCVRRCTNFFILYKSHDADSFNMISKKVGLKKDKLMEIFNKHCPKRRDSLWIDLTNDTPAYIRLNGYDVIYESQEDLNKKTKEEELPEEKNGD